MSNLIQVLCENSGTKLFVKEGATLMELSEMVSIDSKSQYIAAWVDNKLKDLSFRIFSEKSIRFVEINSSEGMRIYARSLFFILEKAVRDIMPTNKLRMMHPVGRGYYCELGGLSQVSIEQIEKIKVRMRQLIEADMPIVRSKIEYAEAIEMYEKQGANDKLSLLRTRPRYFATVYNLGGVINYLFGAMVPSTGYIKTFDIEPFFDGIVILMPRRNNIEIVEKMCIQAKLFDVFRQNKQWADILGVSNVGQLNEKIMKGEGNELIKIGEALQEKNFAATADKIFERKNVKLVLIAGPSSSGKTSFSKRLSIQLRVLGLTPHTISLDNYFVDREHTPRDKNGNYDFECLEAIDIDSFNRDLVKLFAGENVELCKFSFHDGKRYHDGETMKLTDKSILIVEGIHALNPALTSRIDKELVFNIYASALTTLSLDDMNVISTTDNRLLRRMVRDNKYRSRSAYETLKGWQSVRRGEDKHIFPFQENSDVMFGTSLFFEIPILKKYATPLLQAVPENVPEHAEALRLMRLLNCFYEMSDTELPSTSILREFIGGSSFDY